MEFEQFRSFSPQRRLAYKVRESSSLFSRIRISNLILTFRLRTAVELREVASESILDFAVVEILVRDVNDHPPKIQTTILPPAQLEENTGRRHNHFSKIQFRARLNSLNLSLELSTVVVAKLYHLKLHNSFINHRQNASFLGWYRDAV